MRTSENGLHHLRRAVFACTILMLAGLANAQHTPEIHPPKIRLQHGGVTAVRSVPAYASALGASTDVMGEIRCISNNANPTIKQTTIFRVETSSRYFDLSKLCTNDANGYDGPAGSTAWSNWQRLRVGEPVAFRVVKTTTKLSVPRCQRLGILSKSFDPFSVELDSKAEKIYESHCTYDVREAYVRVKRPSYYANNPSPSGFHYDLWTFRVVDSGPRAAAKTTQIGPSYSVSLPPPW